MPLCDHVFGMHSHNRASKRLKWLRLGDAVSFLLQVLIDCSVRLNDVVTSGMIGVLTQKRPFGLYLESAAATSAASFSISSAFSFVNGLGMSRRESTAVSPTRTSKHPLRGFSGLMATFFPGCAALRRDSSLLARVLNAPHDLQASMTTSAARGPLVAGSSAGAFAAFLGAALAIFLFAVGVFALEAAALPFGVPMVNAERVNNALVLNNTLVIL
mmetsp:Transcript_178/g.334  ORF Transcript_178/g.334 Transcript_178/m.334 type:complete len:215 (+) Transcript_178:58-702(+)